MSAKVGLVSPMLSFLPDLGTYEIIFEIIYINIDNCLQLSTGSLYSILSVIKPHYSISVSFNDIFARAVVRTPFNN
jgi:hypothetical protein